MSFKKHIYIYICNLKAKNSFVDDLFHVCKMVEIHHIKPLVTSLIFILHFEKNG